MKLHTGLAVAGLASLAAASPSPAVYVRNDPATPTNPTLDVPPQYARLALAKALGVSKFYEFGVQDADEKKLEALDRIGGRPDLFTETTEGRPRIVLSIGGMSLEDMSGVTDEPTFRLTNSPSTVAADGMVRNFAEEWSLTTGHKLKEMRYENGELKSGHCMTTSSLRMHQPLRTMLEAVSEELDINQYEDQALAFEYLTLQRLVAKLPKDDALFCHFHALEDLITAHGEDTKPVKSALQLYNELLSHAAMKHVLILTPPTTANSIDYYAAVHHKREFYEESPFTMVSTQQTIENAPSSAPGVERSNDQSFSSPSANTPFLRCYKSEELCTEGTNSCSGHGKCANSNGCWSCACKATVKKTDRDGEVHVKTTHWAGNACEKKDISVPFNIFLLFSIIMVVAIGAVIGMMFQMGNEPLPSVLSAGVAPSKKA
ncbi:hypothetical protein EX30DRAFT_393442 [Ascodesmis nigricans]|uniref:Uncharacterized protein n=1 Tax=Ascodesmis nigricans TaxID=341454 RepID=A0A4V3SJG5_9PEZI|nr:hypothetical protein EX30DRAFT_393442 [Ascodesmis nigricans]